MSESGNYAASERHLYQPSPCTRCKWTETYVADWQPLRVGSGPTRYMPTALGCRACERKARRGG